MRAWGLGAYLVGQVEGGDAQRPEAADHGEDAEAQVLPWRGQQEGVLALRLAGVVALQAQGRRGNRSPRQPQTWPLPSDNKMTTG